MVDTPDSAVTPAPSETAPLEPLKNDATPPTTPTVNVVDPAEVERLKKEAEQARMEANQARNEAARIKAEQDAAKQKQLEEKEEFKTLYEQTQSQLDEIKAREEARERQSVIDAAANEILKEFPENVQKLAQTTGLSLTDDSEAAKAEFSEKLKEVQSQVGTSQPSVATNPNTPIAPPTDRAAREQLVARKKPGEPSPMAMASAKGDDSVFEAYVASLPPVQRMKEIARDGA